MAATKYNPEENQEYQQYLQKMESLRQDRPQYGGTYTQEREQLYGALKNRDGFTYDINSDALYRQLQDQYLRQGSLAMEDTMARAQAMTGGYGNSYAQTAGQQTYQNYLSQLYQQLPELYDRALEQYDREGQQLQQQYDLTREQEQLELDQYKSALDSYRRDLEYLQGQADSSYDRGYRQYQEDYDRQSQAYTRLTKLISEHGYQPTDEELRAAGMTRAQADALSR